MNEIFSQFFIKRSFGFFLTPFPNAGVSIRGFACQLSSYTCTVNFDLLVFQSYLHHSCIMPGAIGIVDLPSGWGMGGKEVSIRIS